jgi:hypothetical protein
MPANQEGFLFSRGSNQTASARPRAERVFSKSKKDRTEESFTTEFVKGIWVKKTRNGLMRNNNVRHTCRTDLEHQQECQPSRQKAQTTLGLQIFGQQPNHHVVFANTFPESYLGNCDDQLVSENRFAQFVPFERRVNHIEQRQNWLRQGNTQRAARKR